MCLELPRPRGGASQFPTALPSSIILSWAVGDTTLGNPLESEPVSWTDDLSSNGTTGACKIVHSRNVGVKLWSINDARALLPYSVSCLRPLYPAESGSISQYIDCMEIEYLPTCIILGVYTCEGSEIVIPVAEDPDVSRSADIITL